MQYDFNIDNRLLRKGSLKSALWWGTNAWLCTRHFLCLDLPPTQTAPITAVTIKEIPQHRWYSADVRPYCIIPQLYSYRHVFAHAAMCIMRSAQLRWLSVLYIKYSGSCPKGLARQTIPAIYIATMYHALHQLFRPNTDQPWQWKLTLSQPKTSR